MAVTILALFLLNVALAFGQAGNVTDTPTPPSSTPAPSPAQQPPDSGPDERVVCYMAGWARYRHAPVKFTPASVNPDLCTHLVVAFALLDKPALNLIQADPPGDETLYRTVVGLKKNNTNLKVMLSVGGWKMGSAEFSRLVSSPYHMEAFAANAAALLRQYGFDGLDVDWEYPGDRGSPAGDKQRFTQLLKILHGRFNNESSHSGHDPLLLSIAIGVSPSRVHASYQMAAISNYIDFVNVMSYDLHGTWEHNALHAAPLYSVTGDPRDSIDAMMKSLLRTGVPAAKVNLGLPFYGTSFTLADPHDNTLGAPVTGKGAAGPLFRAKGTLAYFEVCNILTKHNDTVTSQGRLEGTQAPFLVDGRRWTGYDDPQSITEKVVWARQHGLGGVFVWSLDLDDFPDVCGSGRYPLMKAIHRGLQQPLVGR